LARQEAGIADWREIETVEYPPRPLVQWPSFGPQVPGLFGLGSRLAGFFAGLMSQDASAAAPATVAVPGLSDYDTEYLRSIVRTRGQAALLVAPDVVPEAWQGQ